MWIKFSKLLLTIKNIALLGVGIALCIALVNSLINLGIITWANINGESTYYNLIEELITFFLYFEFIALIVKYFKNNFHFIFIEIPETTKYASSAFSATN